jgi:protein-tyrosine-phosphatase
MNILIVCLGNTCRSPMAAGLLSRLARELGIPVSVRTGGLKHDPNSPLKREAIEVMLEIGVDIRKDYSKPVTEADLQWADAVVCLDRRHLIYLQEDYPEAVGKLRYLGHDVKDPFNKTLDVYRARRDELDKALREMAKTLFSP